MTALLKQAGATMGKATSGRSTLQITKTFLMGTTTAEGHGEGYEEQRGSWPSPP